MLSNFWTKCGNNGHSDPVSETEQSRELIANYVANWAENREDPSLKVFPTGCWRKEKHSYPSNYLNNIIWTPLAVFEHPFGQHLVKMDGIGSFCIPFGPAFSGPAICWLKLLDVPYKAQWVTIYYRRLLGEVISFM